MEGSSRPRFQPRPGPNSLLPVTRFTRDTRDPSVQDIGNTPPRAMGSWRTTGPVGGSQQAGSSVIAGRKLFNRTQNPPRAGVNTTRSFSDIPSNTPGRVFTSSSFRSGLANGNSAKFTFSPRIPTNTARESFPAVTPGRSFRGASADMTGRAMSKASNTHLFPMRIASPPPELDGEELAKQVPDIPDRVGSIYADEYLSHLVPSELDDLQRRQFLCILDLRRLKYAANEIFAKKDWRVNIMNFAKEYEKSRSLIMLRYGLYEFKTVPASREVLRKWKQENNVPDEDEEMGDDSTLQSNGGTNSFRSSMKRRAEDDLIQESTSRSFSSGSQTKRRITDREALAEPVSTSNAGATPFPKKTKRGAEQMDVSDDENQPNKLQKSKPSATRSLFEEVANNSPAKKAASPPKAAPKSLFATDIASSKPQSNLFAQPSDQTGQSVLSGAKASGLGNNIFGHLSERNTPMGSDDEQDDEDGSDEDVEEIPAPEKEDAAPAAPSAPSSLFAAKPSVPSGNATTNNLFGKAPSIMDRVTKPSQPSSPPKQAPPQDKTWNPNTPIKFGSAPSATDTPLFGASTTQAGSLFAKPNEGSGIQFGATETPKPAETPAFGTQVKDFAQETPKASGPSLFGQAEKSGATTSSSLFGNIDKTPTPLFGKPTDQKASDSTKAPATPSLFGGNKTFGASTTPFGKPTETPATQTQSKPIFGMNTPAASTESSAPSLFGANNEKPATSLFGATNGDKPSTTSTLFGAPSTVEDKKEESAAKRKKPDTDSESKEAPKFTFGGNAPAFAEKLPPKSAAAADGATDAASVFGAPSDGKKTYSFGMPSATPTAAPAITPAPPSLFGAAAPSTQAEPATTQPSIFASAAPAASGFTFGSQATSTPANTQNNSIFGMTNNTSNTNQSSGFSFGGVAPAPSGGSSFAFNAGGGDSFKNPFASTGDASQPPSFDFGAASNTSGSAPFQFGGGAAAPAPSTSFTFGAGSQPANSNSAPPGNLFGGGATDGGSSMFSFGGASQQPAQPAMSGMFSGAPANAAQGIFASQLSAPPVGSSTGSSK